MHRRTPRQIVVGGGLAAFLGIQGVLSTQLRRSLSRPQAVARAFQDESVGGNTQ